MTCGMEMYISCQQMETHETGGAKETHNVPTNKLRGVLNIFNQISLSLEEMGAAHILPQLWVIR